MRWLWRVLTRNLLLKSTALVCAVVVWVYVDSFAPAERTIALSPFWPFAIPSAVGDREGPKMIELSDTGIQVTIAGPSRRVRLICSEDIHWNAPSGRKVGDKMVFDLRKQDFIIRGVGGVRIQDINPMKIEIRISRFETPPQLP